MLSIYDGGRGGGGVQAQPGAGAGASLGGGGAGGGSGGVTFQDEGASLEEGLKTLDTALADIASTLAVPEVRVSLRIGRSGRKALRSRTGIYLLLLTFRATLIVARL